MKVLFAVFSGTGNTRRVAQTFAEGLTSLGHLTELYMIKKGAPMPEVGQYDVLIVGYPVHAFNAPTALISFVKELPAGEKPVYLLRTSGEPSKLNDASGITPRRILTKKGYSVKGEFTYVMPYNIIFRHSDGMVSRMWRAACLRIERDIRTVDTLQGELRKVGPLRRSAAFVLRIEHPAMPLIGKTFHVAKDKCIGCGACAKLCPCGNIRMVDGRPKFGMHCVGCMGCSFSCPQDAVRISLLNLWRVNGKYAFTGEPSTDEETCRYLHGMYNRYFHETEDMALRTEDL